MDNKEISMVLPMILATFLSLSPPAPADDPPGPRNIVRYAFDAPEEASAFVATAAGEAATRKAKPKIAEGRLSLMESWWKSTTAAAFEAPTISLRGTVEVSWKMTMNTGTEGAGFAWLAMDRYGENGPAPDVEKWEAPDIKSSFGVGFDARNPVNRDPFRGSGNTYDRPQHEVSLHWDGMEIVKRLAPMDFRDGEPHDVAVRIQFAAGGADVTLRIDDMPVFEEYFIASMTAYVGRPAFGSRNEETAGDVLIDDLAVTWGERIEQPDPPLSITAIDRKLNDAEHKKNEAVAAFPDNTDEYARIICTLRLDKPEKRFDPWDRLASINAYGDDGERFEIIRYITPYHRGHVWKVDVTDFRPLLRGERKIEQACTTYGEGWVVTVKFDFYPGATDRLAYKVINLWSGAPEIGNPDKPVEEFYAPKEIPLDEDSACAKARMVVTGHGMLPNTNNAAEFMPLGRTLTINSRPFRNVLWKTDNYLNPCRPQGGTWKYDRAGWAPGDVVRPWEIDATPLIDERRVLHITYELDPYVNEARGKTWAPTHKTESHLILYRKRAIAQWPLLFEEDFEKGGARWSATDPEAWKVIEEEGNHVYSLHQSSGYKPPVRSPHSIAWIKDLDVTDFVFEARMKQTGREYGHRDLCVFFGKQDAARFYYVHIATKADAHANSIFLVNGTPRVSIANERTGGTDWGDGYHLVRVERRTDSGTIKVFFDDMERPIMRAKDSTFRSGGIGVGSFDDVGNFDDIRVWGIKK